MIVLEKVYQEKQLNIWIQFPKNSTPSDFIENIKHAGKQMTSLIRREEGYFVRFSVSPTESGKYYLTFPNSGWINLPQRVLLELTEDSKETDYFNLDSTKVGKNGLTPKSRFFIDGRKYKMFIKTQDSSQKIELVPVVKKNK